MRRVRNAFTLIELLVVVAIISLLVAMLLPSLAQAKELARQTVCTTQVRHILMGYEFCANDRDGYIPNVPGHYGLYRPDGSSTGSYYWPNYYLFYAGTSPWHCIPGYSRLWYWGYLEDPAVFFCPTHTADSSGDASKEVRWDPYIQGTPDNITFFNCPWPEPYASYAQRWCPDAVYVGGGMDCEERESRWDEIPSDYWFLVCPHHFYHKGQDIGPIVYGYVGACVEVYTGPRGAW